MRESLPFNLRQDQRTIEAMMRLFCRKEHGSAVLCRACTDLLAHALQRIERCPFGAGKTICARCPTPCYGPSLRERMRLVMRRTGPHLWRRHPWLSLWHLWQSAKGPPTRPTGRR